MKVYRLMPKKELDDFLVNGPDNVGKNYSQKPYNSYKPDNKKVCMYFASKKIDLIKYVLPLKKHEKVYMVEFEIPFWVLARYRGKGWYDTHGFDLIEPIYITEFEVPLKHLVNAKVVSISAIKDSCDDFLPQHSI